MRVALFGGSFDPIHYGHLRIAEEAREQAHLDTVHFVPAQVSPFKMDRTVTSAARRAEMVRRAIQDNPAFMLSTLEIERAGPSYTIDTVRQVQETLSASSELFFLTGSDAVRDLPQWREPDELLRRIRFLVAARPGVAPDTVLADFPAAWRARIVFLPVPGLEISSTDLRARAAENRSLRYLLPTSVEAYIADNRLYQP